MTRRDISKWWNAKPIRNRRSLLGYRWRDSQLLAFASLDMKEIKWVLLRYVEDENGQRSKRRNAA
jgi:hypothetical protein